MFSSILYFFGYKGRGGKGKTVSSKGSFNEQISKSVDDFMNRPVHSVLTMEILDSLSDENLEQTIIDNLYSKLATETSYEKQYDIIKGLSIGR